MATIQSLSVKTLVKVLTELRGGSLGFDPYRDDRTNNKSKLLAFILNSYDNSAIIAAVSKVTGSDGIESTASGETPKLAMVRLHYKDPSNTPGVRDFAYKTLREALNAATAWLHTNPMMRSVTPGIQCLRADNTWGPLPPLTDSPEESTASYTHAVQASNTASSDVAEVWVDEMNDLDAKPAAKPFKPGKPVSMPNTATAAAPEADQIAKLLASMASKGAVDAEKVREICDARAQDYVDNILEAVNGRLNGFENKIESLQMPTTVHLLKAGETVAVDLGLQHKQFPTLLKMANAKMRDGMRLNIWLKGPAGSGKTTAAKKVAEALGMQFQFNGAISTEYELMGFRDAAGNYHTTAFREIFENGGVYLFDEVDSSLPKAVLAFNAALANGECRFPDKMVARHKDCVVIAGANTAGNGATSDYVGRMKQDLAFLNRFVMLDWPLDEALEKALAANKKWTKHVQTVRERANKRGVKNHIISPRATFYGEALLAAGIDFETVEAATLKGGLTDDTWQQLRNSSDATAFAAGE